MRKEDFYTVPKANAGIKFPLLLDGEKDSGHWLLIRGIDSDAFRKSRMNAARAIRDLPEDATEQARAEAMDEAILDNLAALVAGWSFDEEFTDEAVRDFLKNAPHIASAIDRVAADRSRFFGVASEG